jgi:hypothetical protein
LHGEFPQNAQYQQGWLAPITIAAFFVGFIVQVDQRRAFANDTRFMGGMKHVPFGLTPG